MVTIVLLTEASQGFTLYSRSCATILWKSKMADGTAIYVGYVAISQ